MRRLLSISLLALVFAALVPAATPARADLPGFRVSIWDIHTNGIWRKEVRTREVARWYRHYTWVNDVGLWLNRRAEGVWLTRQSLTQFTCTSHCILRNPNGDGFWRIWRTFTVTDIRRFRAHWRVFWAGHVNPVVAEAAGPPTAPNPLNGRFMVTLDHLEITTPMEPMDPLPSTPFNEAVMVMDDNGLTHFLGQPGFEQMPDTAGNPNGFMLATTTPSEELLPPPPERLFETPIPMMGMFELNPGVIIQWLVDDNGNVLVDADGNGAPDPILSPGVLGGQKHQGLLEQPTGMDGHELAIPCAQPQMHCWALDAAGNVLGAIPGQTIIGPPVDINGDGEADNAIGAPIPMDPTIRDDNDVPMPTGDPADLAVVEEGPPTAAELAQVNQRLILAGFQPLQPPFRLCIRQLRVRSWWGIDRRFVMDCWRHHWIWRVAHHITLTGGANRIWLTRLALSQFISSHHHYVVGQPPTWNMFTLTDVRFFRVCYRVHCPQPGVVRVRIDELWLVVPVHPEDPNSDLALLTTVESENRLLPPGVLAGLVPDPLPVGPGGIFVEPIDPVLGMLDVGGGATGSFDGDLQVLLNPPGTMVNLPLLGNQDLPTEVNDNQLRLFCWALDAQGNPKQSSFDAAGPIIDRGGGCPADLNADGTVGAADLALLLGSWGPGGGAADFDMNGFVNSGDLAFLLGSWGPCPPAGLTLTEAPTPAMPMFMDELGNPMPNPTDMGMMMQADPMP